MNARVLFRPLLAGSLALVLACGGADAYAGRRRPVIQTPAPAVAQWNHDWARGAVFYEIFVRSFADSNADGIGDFNGLISRLDYLNDGNPATTTDLGVDGIWLMPIFQSPSYHGYDTLDYETIESDYGTNADFQRFLDEAHRRGIRVIIDFVMNHTGSDHPWFIDSASAISSPRRNWYVWSATDPGWRQPWGGNDPSWHRRNNAYYYGAFWSGMPDLNYRSSEVKAEMLRLSNHWLGQGVDGYRLDATRYLVETGPGEAGQADTTATHQVLKELSAEVRRVKPDAILVAENTTDTVRLAAYFGSTATIKGGDEMPMNFNFPLASAVLQGVNTANADPIRETLQDVISAYPAGVIDTPFLTNHDQTRVATVLGNDAGKLRSAAAILLTLPGAPFIYYGEEVGMQNGPTSADESKRTPMPWNASGGFTAAAPWHGYAPGIEVNNIESQINDPESLWSYYRDWIAARKSSPGLRKGDIKPLETGRQVLGFLRNSGDERVLVLHNLSSLAIQTGPLPVSAVALERIYADAGVSDPTGGTSAWRVMLPAHTSGVWRLR
jgi:glycosidase